MHPKGLQCIMHFLLNVCSLTVRRGPLGKVVPDKTLGDLDAVQGGALAHIV